MALEAPKDWYTSVRPFLSVLFKVSERGYLQTLGKMNAELTKISTLSYYFHHIHQEYPQHRDIRHILNYYNVCAKEDYKKSYIH